MLDNIDVGGLESLNTTAAWLIGTAVVILVVGVAVGALVFSSGKSTQNSQRSTKGMATMGISVAAAVLLGGIGPAVAWGMDRGNETLMPEAAQPTEITVERQEPATTCDLETEDFSDNDSNQEGIEWARELVGPDHADEGPLGDRSFLEGSIILWEVNWYPDGQGGDCEPEEELVAECTEVELVFDENTLTGTDSTKETIFIDGEDCQES